MPTPQLLQILSFENLGPGVPAVLPHNININGVAQKPDIAMCDVAGVSLTITETTVTALNTTAENIAQAYVWLELKHSVDRELGTLFGSPWESMDPRPFIPASGGSARGPFLLASVDAGATDASRTHNVASITHVLNTGLYVLNLTTPAPEDVAVAVTTLGIEGDSPGLIAYEWDGSTSLRIRTWGFGDGVEPQDLPFSVSVWLTTEV